MPKPKTQTPKLNDTQLVIMSAAARRSDHALLPFPQNLSVKGTALDKVVAMLIKRNLIGEQHVAEHEPQLGALLRRGQHGHSR